MIYRMENAIQSVDRPVSGCCHVIVCGGASVVVYHTIFLKKGHSCHIQTVHLPSKNDNDSRRM